jgi:hypothetical protein
MLVFGPEVDRSGGWDVGVRQIAAWISGYHHGNDNNPIVDKQQTLGGIKQLEEYCFKHPDDLLMKEADHILGAQ